MDLKTIITFALSLFFSLNLLAQVSVTVPSHLYDDELGAQFLQQMIEENQQSLITFNANSYLMAKKEFHILWALGEKDLETTRDEYKRLWRIINNATAKGFNTQLNTMAFVDDIKASISSSTTSVILLSGHGNEDGFYDYNLDLVPYDSFENVSRNLKQFVLAACYGKQSIHHYNVPSHIKLQTWSLLTDTYEMMDYLDSDKWDMNASGAQ